LFTLKYVLIADTACATLSANAFAHGTDSDFVVCQESGEHALDGEEMNDQQALQETMRELGSALHACLEADGRKTHLQNVHRLLCILQESAHAAGSVQLGSNAKQATTLVEACILPETVTEPEMAQLVGELQKLLYGLSSTPPREATARMSTDATSASPEVAIKTVYLVNDNLLLARDAALQLQCFGYQVVIAAHLDQLAALFAKRLPNCIVLDQGNRDSAFAKPEDIARIRSLSERHVPILLLSSRSNFEARLAAVRAGVDSYLIKPVDIVSLTDRIDTLTLRKEKHPYRILIVGSDSARLTHYEDMLVQAGMEVAGLQKPIDLFRTLSQYRPELVVMDVHAAACTGIDLTTLIRQDKSFLDLPLLVLSEDSDPRTRRSAIHAGADDFLLTPIAAEDLVFSVSSRVERSRALRGLIMRDGLTGLYNHSSIKEHLVREIARSKRDGTPLALAMVDLDFFKKINDSYGHPVGDQVIRAISRILQQRLRHGDLVGRYGGEEFAVILPVTSAAAASGVLNEIREAFEKIRHKADDTEFFATFSAGVAELSDATGLADAGELFRIADAALYQAKQAGRNRVALAQRHAGTPVWPVCIDKG